MTAPDATDPIAEPTAVPASAASPIPPRKPLWQRLSTELLIVLVVLTLGGVFAVVVLGIQVPGFAEAPKDEKATTDKKITDPAVSVKLVKDKPHTVEVPEEARTTLGIRKDGKDVLLEVKAPTAMRPLALAGSTALDPTHLARIRVRFAPARVTELGKTNELAPAGSKSALAERELRPGDPIKKDQVLGVFYSDIIGSKKNDLLDALVQLELDQKILDRADNAEGRAATPDVLMYGFLRAVYGDRNAINRALNNLKAWDVSQKEIDDLQVEAHKIASDKNAWLRTPEGRWVSGEKQKDDNYRENPWGRVTIRAPFDGIIVERNLHVDEMVVDNTVNIFQIADVSKLLVIANCPEDQLPALQNEQDRGNTGWTVQTMGKDLGGGIGGAIDLSGHFTEIGYLIDPMQHTAIVKGYVENPGKRLRAGQYVSATVQLKPPADTVEIPVTALVDDGRQSLVFVQTDPSKPQYTMRRVRVTHRYEQTVFVATAPIARLSDRALAALAKEKVPAAVLAKLQPLAGRDLAESDLAAEVKKVLAPEDAGQYLEAIVRQALDQQLSTAEVEEGLLPIEPLRTGERIIKTGTGELKMALLLQESKAQMEAKQKKAKE